MKPTFIENIKKATRSFALLSLLWLFFLILLSVYEIIINGITHGFTGTLAILAANAINTIGFWLKCNVLLYFLFVILYFISAGLSKWFFYIISSALLLIQIGLIQYSVKAMVPLGADFFGYSAADMKQTIGASGGVSVKMILTFVLFLATYIFVLFWYRKRSVMQMRIATVLPLLSIIYFFSSFSTSDVHLSLKTEYARTLALSKSDFFFTQSYKHFFPSAIDDDIYSDSYSGDFGDGVKQLVNFVYTDEEKYPFLHADSTADVLSPFFNKSDKSPNIVIILVEGLGRAFTNDGAYLGNFTPFIDSLSKQSLYWKNFLSEGGRTFAVLPSVLASLPFAKNGFCELGDKMPSHLSLLSLAKYNGYHTSFFYGGDSKFDNMNLFLKKNAIDAINDEPTFPAGYTKLPSKGDFSWGYGDKELFRRYFEVEKDNGAKPQLNVVLTVSTHSPFLVNDQKVYDQKFAERMQQLNFSDDKKKSYQDYSGQYASILFTDDALRTFFNEYKKRSDFNNTIFIITGDHRMPEIPMSTKIDRYHVPLIIYSPLLKRTASFASVSTHYDIAPSLMSFLHDNYNFQKPTLATWMGSGLDTNRVFENTHMYPLMQTKNDIVDFIMDNYHLNGDDIFSISGDMDEEPIHDNDKHRQLLGEFSQFKNRNEKLIKGLPLLPDSIYSKYYPH
ncbi:MAG TPA: LTA synthase family protein [Chitinophagaceae bacterium]|nr:LTA synthase family protein [Chitinophagaceae bacterium]